jgi:hypothetical protein
MNHGFTGYETGNHPESQTTCVGTGCYILRDLIWTTWSQSITVTVQDGIWNAWLDQPITAGLVTTLPPPTEEQIRVSTERNRLLAEADRKRAEEAEEAEGVARKGLIEVISEEQEVQLAKEGGFYLKVDGHRYRIKPGRRVERVNDNGKVLSYFCIHADHSYRLPPSDQALCHLLMLQAEPKEFFRIANELRVA